MFRRSAADLQGASLRVHMTLATGFASVKDLAEQMDSEDQEELLLEDSDEADQDPSPRKSQSKPSRTASDYTAVQHTETEQEDSFPASVVVDRAMHLSLKGLSEYSLVKPGVQWMLVCLLCLPVRLSSSRAQ